MSKLELRVKIMSCLVLVLIIGVYISPRVYAVLTSNITLPTTGKIYTGGNGGNGGGSYDNAVIYTGFETGNFLGSESGTATSITTWGNGLAEISTEQAHGGSYSTKVTVVCEEGWFPPEDPRNGGNFAYYGNSRARIVWAGEDDHDGNKQHFVDPDTGQYIHTRDFYTAQWIYVTEVTVRNGIEFLRYHQLPSSGNTGGKSGYVARFFIKPDTNGGFRFSVNLGGTNGVYYEWFPRGYGDVVKSDFGNGLQLNRWYFLETRVDITANGGVQAWIDGVEALNTIGQYDCSTSGGQISMIQMGSVTSSPSGAELGQAVIYYTDDIGFGYERMGS